MKNLSRAIQLVIISGLLLVGCKETEYKVFSPNGQLSLQFALVKGEPHYSLFRDGEPIILPSKLGFDFQNMPSMKGNFRVVNTVSNSHSSTWEQPWGESRFVNDIHNELVVELQETNGKNRQLSIVFRLFDDGLGFRYIFPEQPNLDSLIIANEHTEFTFPAQHNVWWIPSHDSFETILYESLYTLSPIGETSLINTPATIETDGGLYLAIHEANLTDYASMNLRMVSGTQFVSELIPWSNGVKVYAKAPFATPWRTIIVAQKAGELITSNIMLNLNEPSALNDVSWIEPQKYMGIWWGMHINKYTWAQGPNHGATTKNAKKYLDFAAKHGFDGVLIEGWNFGWDGQWHVDGNDFNFTRAVPSFDLEEVARYAASKNVRLIGHHETGGAVSNYERQMEDAYALYKRLGVNTIKTGYVNRLLDHKEFHDGQAGVRHFRKSIEMAAKYQIMLNIHEPVKGTGLSRTFPNLMTQEGARGQEYNAWSADGGNPPAHNTILPFTRLLAGPMDYTPGIFVMTNPSNPIPKVQSTLAKQLALYVVIYSPLQMAADLPEHYEGHPAFEFIKVVPCNWHQTVVIDGEIGEHVTIARRDWNSEEWYLGSITNEHPREFTFPLSFLESGRNYRAEIYSDGLQAHWDTNPYAISIDKSTTVNSETKLNIILAPGGGTAIRFIPL